MAVTFALYTDSALTNPFSGLYQLVHKTDLSDNPQDHFLYYGSNATLHTLWANSNPGVDQITLTPTYGIGGWVAATAHIVGDMVIPTTPNTYRYVCTTAGTTHASVEPTWPTSSLGTTVADGTCVWTLTSKVHPITEVKLALTSGGLAGATGGAALNLGTSILSGSANAVKFYVRVTNTVVTAGLNTGHPELLINYNTVVETG